MFGNMWEMCGWEDNVKLMDLTRKWKISSNLVVYYYFLYGLVTHVSQAWVYFRLYVFFAMVGLYQCFVWSECWVNWLECYSFSNKRWKPMRYDHPKYWHEYAFLSSIESPENQEPTSKTRFPLSDKLPFLTSMWSALMRSSEPSHNFSPPEPQKQAHGFTISHLCQPLQHITKTIII